LPGATTACDHGLRPSRRDRWVTLARTLGDSEDDWNRDAAAARAGTTALAGAGATAATSGAWATAVAGARTTTAGTGAATAVASGLGVAL
jgi:hypothetical protein